MDEVAPLLAVAGIDPGLPPARAAALFARSVVLRSEGRSSQRELVSALEETGYLSLNECASALGVICQTELFRGAGFGGLWPWFEVGPVVVAPGVPVAVRSAETEGPDGVYRRVEGSILREAGGRERRLVELDRQEGAERGTDISMLWFGPGERYRLRGPILEIEDLFARAWLRPGRRELERWLVREKRLPIAVIDDLGFLEPEAGAQSLQIARPEELTSDHWIEAQVFFEARADVVCATMHSSELVLNTVDEQRVVFDCNQQEDGWTARRVEGSFLFDKLSARRESESICITVKVDESRNLASAGLRARLAFDLSSDLLSLSQMS